MGFALREFQGAAGVRTVADVSRKIGLSSRRFIQVFTDEVGLTPKLFCRVRRFQEAVQRIGTGQCVNRASVALDCGYFDQAHFIHDFRDFAGVSPSTYLKFRASRNHVAVHD